MADEHPGVPPLQTILYEDLVRAALQEDLGRAGDLTTDAVVPEGTRANAKIAARRGGRLAGLDVAVRAFTLLDPAIECRIEARDGSDVAGGAVLARLTGSARSILGAERTALNFLGRLCGIATATRDVAALVAGTKARITCTRKTTPGLRALEKYAVRVGGGANHRFGLDDAMLIKDNHLAAAGGLEPAVRRARERAGHLVKIQVEVDTLEQLEALLPLGADAVLLDNMPPDTMRRAVDMVDGRMVIEASGSIRPERVRAIAETGVDVISLGWLTHSVTNLDVGLDFELS